MSLQFVFGNSGSGKSTYLYERVLEEAGRNPDKNYLILVPEQFTMSTQRELVRLQSAHAIMNVDVLSFARLAYRVFDELGQENLMVLEDTGKNLVLRRIAEEKKAELKVLGGNMNKMGYVGEVKSLISELSQYNITPDVLQEFLSCAKISETLRMKLEDIREALIYGTRGHLGIKLYDLCLLTHHLQELRCGQRLLASRLALLVYGNLHKVCHRNARNLYGILKTEKQALASALLNRHIEQVLTLEREFICHNLELAMPCNYRCEGTLTRAVRPHYGVYLTRLNLEVYTSKNLFAID